MKKTVPILILACLAHSAFADEPAQDREIHCKITHGVQLVHQFTTIPVKRKTLDEHGNEVDDIESDIPGSQDPNSKNPQGTTYTFGPGILLEVFSGFHHPDPNDQYAIIDIQRIPTQSEQRECKKEDPTDPCDIFDVTQVVLSKTELTPDEQKKYNFPTNLTETVPIKGYTVTCTSVVIQSKEN
jgi:hypothetical protein